jgi:uncharacterized protein YdeI (YjbR/CyaY-like superfamily)
VSRPKFFATPDAFRAWLEAHHERETELLVGFYRKDSGKPSITWPQSVDEALCFGWIDGKRQSIDEISYTIRFTPRKASSNWSAINVKRMAELIAAGRVSPAGLAAFERRAAARTGIYSYENRKSATLDPEFEREFRRNKKAWAYFEGETPSYRRLAIWWVITAKREETRRSRLATLIADSALGRRIPSQRPSPPRRSGSR